MKEIVLRQYQDIVDKAAKQLGDLTLPAEGWIRTVRNSIGMSGAQLARHLGLSRAQISQLEKSEQSESITLKSLDKLAEAMGCRVVYAIVPQTTASDLIKVRAFDKATTLVDSAGTHMALEAQTLNREQRQFEIDRIANKLIHDMPNNLWNDE